MKRIIIPIICLCLLLTGCRVHWNYYTMVKAIDNEYFKTKVMYEDSECMIIENEITGEYFMVVADGYGASITPIQMSEMLVNPDNESDDIPSSPLSEEDYCNSSGF